MNFEGRVDVEIIVLNLETLQPCAFLKVGNDYVFRFRQYTLKLKRL